MGTVDVYTKPRMDEIVDSTLVSAEVDEDGNLIFTRYDETTFDAGYVVGPPADDTPPASETVAGIAEIATTAEVLTGTDNERIVSPAGLLARTATDIRKGIVELATDAEAKAGTDTSRAITPASLKATIENRGLLNKIINGNLIVNQGSYVSGAALVPGRFSGFGHDRFQTSELLNLCTNPSAETNTTSWAATAVTFTRVTNFGVFGTCSFSLVGTASNDSFIEYTLVTVPGMEYTVSAYARLTAALTGTEVGGARARSIYTGGVGNPKSAQAANVLGTTRLSVSFIASTTTTSIRLYHGQTGGTIWWDGVLITEGTTLHTYFDGSTGRWTGTANGSTSGSRSAVCSYTYVQTPQGAVLTLASGSAILTILERADVQAGTYICGQYGTANMRVYNRGSTPPAFAAGPIVVTLDGSADVVIEFDGTGGSKTVDRVYMFLGDINYGFQSRPIQQELALCRRYFRIYAANELSVQNPYFSVALGAGAQIASHPFDVPMRVAPLINNSGGHGKYQVFGYYNASAGAVGNYYTLLMPGINGLFQAAYESTFVGNGGVTLAAARTMGQNANAVSMSSELML